MIRSLVRSMVAGCIKPVPRMAGHGPKFSGRMFSMQDKIPKLPVPALDQTLQRYLDVVRPFLDDADFHQTSKVVSDFRVDPGPILQKLLDKRAQSEINWLTDWWKNVAYLDYRLPVVIHSNPGVLFPQQDYNTIDGQIRYAAKFISGVLDYKVMVDAQTLPVEKMRNQPLCMMQYYRFISACRVPGEKRDGFVVYPPNEPNAPRHIVVAHNNHFFEVNVYGEEDKPLNVDQLEKQLQAVVSQSQEPAVPVGILTSEHRNNWANSYKKLVEDPNNKSHTESIHRSICVVCLDKPGIQSNDDDQRRTHNAEELLHGSGSKYNSGNRWFDKTLEFIIGTDGVCGLNYEHTSAEGPPIISIADHVIKYCDTTVDNPPAAGVVEPRKLEFNISESVNRDIEHAKENLDILIEDLELKYLSFNSFGKNFPKSHKLSPDGFIQVVLQLAYFRLYKKACSTYESGSLRQFQLGRTDTIRSATMDSLAFSKSMDNNSVPANEKVNLFRKAVEAHANFTKETINGQAVDRHLLGLKLISLEHGKGVPQFHNDHGYQKACHIKLSTSQVPAKAESVLCFGPVVPDGYGVCYNPQNEKILFCVSAFNSCTETEASKLAKSLKNTLLDVQSLLLGNSKSKL